MWRHWRLIIWKTLYFRDSQCVVSQYFSQKRGVIVWEIRTTDKPIAAKTKKSSQLCLAKSLETAFAITKSANFLT